MADTIDLGKFPFGMNNIAKETSLPEGSLREAINVDIDDAGNTRLREGYELLYSGSGIGSLYERYFREGTELKYLNDDNTATVVTNVEGKVRYTKLNERIYYTDGYSNGILDGIVSTPLSVETPKTFEVAHSSIGSLEPGLYLVTCAYLSPEGILSGAPITTEIKLFSTGGITVTVPQPIIPGKIVIYCTPGNSPVLHEQAILNYGINTYTISSIGKSVRTCSTQFMDPMPPGQIIEYYKGKLYIAHGNELWFSEPHRYGLTIPSKNFFYFPDRITVCVAVDNGIYVVSDKTYFITFSKTEEATMKEVSQNKAVEGTSLKIPGSSFGFEFESDLAYWFSEEGAVVGLPNGQIHNLTDDVLAVSDNTSKVGTSLQREYNGIKQIISSMPKGGEVSSLQSNDTATLTVIRNGIVIVT